MYTLNAGNIILIVVSEKFFLFFIIIVEFMENCKAK